MSQLLVLNPSQVLPRFQFDLAVSSAGCLTLLWLSAVELLNCCKKIDQLTPINKDINSTETSQVTTVTEMCNRWMINCLNCSKVDLLLGFWTDDKENNEVQGQELPTACCGAWCCSLVSSSLGLPDDAAWPKSSQSQEAMCCPTPSC